MKLDQWAKLWNIPAAALSNLKSILGLNYDFKKPNLTESEAGIQSKIRLEAAQKGCYLWRNNVGAVYTVEGSFMRYGLANDSAKVNKCIKSADLIGVRPVKITTDLVGFTIGQFMSREIKKSNWRYSGNERELAQLQWAELILSLGGDACFANDVGTI